MKLREFCIFSRVILFVLAVLFAAKPAPAGDKWQPVTAEELALKDVPESPGAPAVILYRSVESNNAQEYEKDYVRIKILTQEGTKYGNIQTPPYQNYTSVDDIKARTIKPDGTIVPFNGKIFEKVVAKNKEYKELVKTFTMPDVQVGSIIEYRYKRRFFSYSTLWLVQDELFTKKAQFIYRPGPNPAQWLWQGLGKGVEPKKQKDGRVLLTVENVLPFERERFMPPEEEIRGMVYFFYRPRVMPKTIEEYWKEQAEYWKKSCDYFMDKPYEMKREVAAILKTEDTTAEAKMRRLYTRVQQIRNLYWEPDKTEKEQAKERLKDNSNVADVLSHGYGYQNEINKLYTALLRAAGIKATLIRVAERDDSFLHKNVPLWRQLSWDIVVANDGQKDYFLDPGTLYCPFGQLSWEDTAVPGWRLDTMDWGEVPAPPADATTETHKADLELDRDGTLTGTLHVSYTGVTALSRRSSSRDDDETKKKKDFEDEVKGWLPSDTKVEVVKMDGWTNPEVPLTVDFKITINGLGTSTSKRILLPTSVFQGEERHPFQFAKRVHPVYIHFPFRDIDEVAITLPEGFELEAPPVPKEIVANFAKYRLNVKQDGQILRIRRDFEMDFMFFPVPDYPKLQYFYNRVKAGDNDQAVLKAAVSSVAK